MSLCLAPPGELAFLLDPVGPGTRALAALEPGEALDVLGPLGNGFRLDVARPLLVGGGIGIAPLPYLSERLGGAPARPRLPLGRATPRRPRSSPAPRSSSSRPLVTERPDAGRGTSSPAGPSRCSTRSRALAPRAQLAWEAPMACGYGACYGCAVEIRGELRRLCVEGPVLAAADVCPPR